MKQLLVIHAHGKAQEVFDFNLPLFERHALPILVISPEDDPIRTTHNHLAMGMAAHSGEFAWRRLRLMLNELAVEREDVEHFAILEYDSFFLTKRIPMEPGFWGLVQTSLDPAFFSLRYPTPPWTIDGISVKAFNHAAQSYPFCKEQGMADRYLAALSDITHTRISDYEPIGLARNTIEERDLPMVNRHLGAGAFAFHGVKTREVRDYIVRVWNSLQADPEEKISLP